jgi:hypothetical protein
VVAYDRELVKRAISYAVAQAIREGARSQRLVNADLIPSLPNQELQDHGAVVGSAMLQLDLWQQVQNRERQKKLATLPEKL